MAKGLKKKRLGPRARRVAPLKASFLFASIVGFLFSVLIVKKWSITWAFAFALVFVLVFIASIISMRWSPDSQLSPRIGKG